MMTNIYESELLYKLMERDGLNVPSSVPPYESEIKAYLIEQVKLAYPKLTDYEAEWLLYNYTKHLPAEFPIESITNVTDATVNNVVPYAYKSAILKGNTKYRDIDTGDILDKFDETKNLELVSVKMPVLTTTGKNLCNRVRGYHSNTGGTENLWASFDMSCKPNTTYTAKIFSGSNNRFGFFSGVGVVGSTNSYKITGGDYVAYTGGEKTFTITTGNNDNVMWLYLNNNYIVSLDDVVVQVEESPTATTYEPHKSNILSTNEDVTLRGIGDVQDTLDCLTGEVTERVGEVVLNGTENWRVTSQSYQPTDSNFINFELGISSIKRATDIICDNIPVRDWKENSTQLKSRSIATHSGNNILRLCIEKSIAPDVVTLKQYLQSNNSKVYYQLATNTVKTVDLSVVDENGNEIKHFMPIEGTMHIQTDGEPIKPSVTMEIPVEATTQNLASFIDLEMEE